MPAPTIADVRTFYDEFSRGLLADYAHGNPRIEAAIRHALRWLPAGAPNVLDVGCGIGWSTWEIQRHRPGSRVTGLDLSGDMIRIAQTLFSGKGPSFVAADIASGAVPTGAPFDVVVMLDVYEHIPRASRADLHRIVGRMLARSARVVLSCPSLSHQAWLRANAPRDLQPVDEDVSEEDVATFAREIDGRVAHFAHVSIWNRDDYVHALLERGDARFRGRAGRPRRVALEARSTRARRAHQRLGLRVTRPGVMIPDREGPVVCLITPNQLVNTESFIRDQAERLPARVRVLHDGWLPVLDDDDRPLVAPLRPMIGPAARLLGVDPGRLGSRLARRCPLTVRVRALRDWLRRTGVRVVLAHYGPTGVAVLEACVAADVPLVVHFHGFDASDRETLERSGREYPRLFERAAGIIAVSRDMERDLLALGARRETLHVAPCGVDLARFRGADPAQAPPRFIAVGRFVEKKAPHLTIQAFARAVAQCPEARLVMIGDGERLDECRQLALRIGLEGRIEFAGPRSHRDVAAAMRGARAFVQHSVTAAGGDREGTPVAVLEAGASGLPVIATRHGGIREAVLEGESGLLVNEGDVEGMARHMVALATDPARAAALGRRGLRHVAEHYSIERSIERLWRVLEAAIERGTRRP